MNTDMVFLLWFFFGGITVVTLLCLYAGIMGRRAVNRRVLAVFGVNRRTLTHWIAEETLRRLASEAGVLMLTQEALQGQLDPNLLSVQGERVRERYAKFRDRQEAIGGAILTAKRRLEDADLLFQRVTGQVGYLPRRKEDGRIDIVALPPYNQADWARQATARRRETERRERLNRRLRNTR